jgi:hypothetical protein
MAWTERYVTTTGAGTHDGTSEANAWTLAEAITNSNAGHRLNVKAGTYANTTTSLTFGTGAGAGTTTSPKWWRGYTSAIGDLDAEPSSARVAGTDFPLLTFTSGSVTISGSYQTFSHFEFRATAPGTRLVGGSGAHLRLDRCRVDNQEAAGSSYAVRLDGNGLALTRCWFKATSSATSVVLAEERGVISGCVFSGGGNGLLVGDGASSIPSVTKCIFNDNGNDGLQFSNGLGAQLTVTHCSFYSCGRDGVRIPGNAPAAGIIADCVFSACVGYGINNATGANTANVHRVGNLFHSSGTADENGFGDAPSPAQQSDGSSPFVNAASGDFAPAAASNSRLNSAPELFENIATRSYRDIGAVQHEDAGGGVAGRQTIITNIGTY